MFKKNNIYRLAFISYELKYIYFIVKKVYVYSINNKSELFIWIEKKIYKAKYITIREHFVSEELHIRNEQSKIWT